jgi:hypothetical protein
MFYDKMLSENIYLTMLSNDLLFGNMLSDNVFTYKMAPVSYFIW